MLFISYVTKDHYLEVLNKYLFPSLTKWDLSFHIEYIEPAKDWYAATAQKCDIILKLLKCQEDIVILDADAEIVKFPQLFFDIPKSYDMACHYLDWGVQYNKPRDKKELLSGTMLWRNRDISIKVLETWKAEVDKNAHLWEQRALDKVLNRGTKLNIYELPYEYCSIRRKDGTIPCENPVIIHNQVSRQYKRRNR